jgi:hypothetical protein
MEALLENMLRAKLLWCLVKQMALLLIYRILIQYLVLAWVVLLLTVQKLKTLAVGQSLQQAMSMAMVWMI